MNYINIFSRYYINRIRLIQIGRKKRSYFKIVVVNYNNKIVADLGYLIPHAEIQKKTMKKVGLDRSLCVFWLLKRAVPSVVVFFLFENLGLIKYKI